MDVAATQLHAVRHDAIEPAQGGRVLDDLGHGLAFMIQSFLDLHRVFFIDVLLQQGLHDVQRAGVSTAKAQL